ncbi:carboxypeptidase-like regulatory domain-containing protein [Flavobacterium sp. UBA6031]|uniref:carboxypeptidase-like regulatory domain-containing protein n=1 Tax=Flavobacterium sp. UBA6031 TaxID=1946551 RepID=UPI0025C13F67|nr:carboxypeptidase-like regulatory domain-containing protein [Flavobacterium sp. UBA6031]
MKTTVKSQISRVLLITSLVFFCSSFFANATGIIKGHVLDSKKQPLNYATATILNPETMKIVEGDMCDSKGEFIIENVKPGDYILSIRMVGYEKIESKKIHVDSLNTHIEVENIELKLSIQRLGEVVVTAKQKSKDQAAEKTYATSKKTIGPQSNFSLTQFDFSNSYKNFMSLYEVKSYNFSIGLKPVLSLSNYLIGFTR